MQPGKRKSIPHFALFGELLSENDPEFIHIETIRARSRVYDWKITPHTHRHLFQLVFARRGAARVQIDGRAEDVRAPCAITVPSGVVHAFTFEPETTGHVATIANTLIAESARQQSRELLEPVIRHANILSFNTDPENSELIEFALGQMHRELQWQKPGRTSMFRWYLHIMLMTVRRQLDVQAQESLPRGKRPGDFHRFRVLVEKHYREQWRVSDYAVALAISPSKLNRLCHKFVGQSALDVVHDRVILEARRLLLYTDVTVSTIAEALGFRDPGYFCRFFKRQTGLSPMRARKRG